MNSKKWLVIGISGTTCSGKTSLANAIHKELKNSVIIHQDDYFLPENDPRHTKIPELNHCNWELLTSMDIDKMKGDISNIIESPNNEGTTENGKRPVLILDGFLLFKCKAISDLCDLKYFLKLPKEVCWERRKKRTYEPADVPGYFEKVVWPEYVKYEGELMNDKDAHKTITFINGTKGKEEIFQMVFVEIKRVVS